MNRRLVFGFTSVLLLLQAFFSMNSHASETVVSVDPQSIRASLGSEITVAVCIRDVADLQLYDLALKYNGSILNLTAVWHPDDHVFAGKSDFYPSRPNVGDTLDGNKYVLYFAYCLRSSVNIAEGVLFKMNFTVMESGETTLFIGTYDNPIRHGKYAWHVWWSYLCDSNTEEMPFTVEHGAVHVNAPITVHYIDVGQGDSILIDTPGKDVLIDGGPDQGSSTVLDYLDGLNITRVHLMIATHPHADHIGGLVRILASTVEVDEILINNQTYDSSIHTEFMNLAANHTVKVAERGQTFILTETVNLTVLNPTQPLEFSQTNDNSIVVKLQAYSVSFLFTGDAEADAEQSMIDAGLDLHCDVLKVGHHGSNSSTTQVFLENCQPSYAIISAGEDNPYGHPHDETVQRLLDNNVTVYGTFLSGTIVASTDGDTIIFESEPEPIPELLPNMLIITLTLLTLCIVVAYREKPRLSLRQMNLHKETQGYVS